MLHTRYKDRLRQGLSYPVGLQDLDKALGDIPQAADLYVSFVASPLPAKDTQFYSLVTRDMPYRIAEARFAKWDKQPSLSNSTFTDEYLRGHWSITVYPVMSVRRAEARKVLLAALPAVHAWFCRTRPESWYHGRKVCEVWFEPTEGTVKVNDIVEAV